MSTHSSSLIIMLGTCVFSLFFLSIVYAQPANESAENVEAIKAGEEVSKTSVQPTESCNALVGALQVVLENEASQAFLQTPLAELSEDVYDGCRNQAIERYILSYAISRWVLYIQSKVLMDTANEAFILCCNQANSETLQACVRKHWKIEDIRADQITGLTADDYNLYIDSVQGERTVVAVIKTNSKTPQSIEHMQKSILSKQEELEASYAKLLEQADLDAQEISELKKKLHIQTDEANVNTQELYDLEYIKSDGSIAKKN